MVRLEHGVTNKEFIRTGKSHTKFFRLTSSSFHPSVEHGSASILASSWLILTFCDWSMDDCPALSVIASSTNHWNGQVSSQISRSRLLAMLQVSCPSAQADHHFTRLAHTDSHLRLMPRNVDVLETGPVSTVQRHASDPKGSVNWKLAPEKTRTILETKVIQSIVFLRRAKWANSRLKSE